MTNISFDSSTISWRELEGIDHLSYFITVSPASNEPHREGGGDQDVIILFSIRGTDGTMYEFVDDDNNVISNFGMDDFTELYELQNAS
jgi:hypothetical protein